MIILLNFWFKDNSLCLVLSFLWTPLPLSTNLPSAPSTFRTRMTFWYETWCVFFLAPRSVSSVPLLHYRSTAPLSPTLKGMQTHIKRGPLILKISRLCSSYFLPSYLSVNVIRMLVGSLSWQHTHTFTRAHTVDSHIHNDRLTNCCPTLCSLGRHRDRKVRSPAPAPPADLSAQVSDGDTHAG